MKNTLRIFIVLLIFAISTQTTESYVRSPTGVSNGAPVAWNLTNSITPIVSNGRITYNLNSAGSDDLPFSEVERVIATSFQTWENVPTSDIAFTRGPNSTSAGTQNDGVFQIYWLENSTTTPDGINLAGAFAVTAQLIITGGPRTSEIIDVSTVFNGNEYRWATDGRADAIDVQEIATHEFGHSIGLAHSPIGGSTMFPRTAPGRIQSRTLSTDDMIAASIAYPAAGFGSSTGTLRGNVRDGGGSNIFGAHVVATNANGVVVTGALSQPDGSYNIQGLPPGSYTVYAEPLDPTGNAFFSRVDLNSFYGSILTDFQTSGDFTVNIGAGSNAALDITVTRGAPALGAYYVSETSGQLFSTAPSIINRGQTSAIIGVAGPGIPQSGSPLSITGSGITVNGTFFGTVGGFPAVLVNVNISPSAPAGARNLIVNNGSQRTIVTGGVDIAEDGGAPSAVSTVSAANFANQVAVESIASAFGGSLAITSASATSLPLPTSLGGTSVRLRDSAGNERLAPLFYISSTQINYQIAPGILTGQASVTVTSGSGAVSTGSINVNTVAPGIFTADATGNGLAAAGVFRIRGDGSQSNEPVARFDPGQNRFVAVPIDLGPATDQVFLILYGTGLRFRSVLPSVSIGGVGSQVTFAGAQGGFVGLDQINVRLDRSLAARGAVNVVMTVDGTPANTVSVTIK